MSKQQLVGRRARLDIYHNYVLHCRTSFSNTNYTAFGYIYHARDKHIRMYGDDIGSDGMGGCLCVRDVQ